MRKCPILLSLGYSKVTGDVLKEAIDIYDHIDKKELRELPGAYPTAGDLNR
jgi:hypothetical protein